jgi:hypothetical protein
VLKTLARVTAAGVMLICAGDDVLSAQQGARTGGGPRQAPSAAEIARRAAASVVTVTTPEATASGVLLDASGTLATTLGVVRGQLKITIRLANGDLYDDVGVIDVDERRDLALLKVKGFGLAAAQLGNSDQIADGARIVIVTAPREPAVAPRFQNVRALRATGTGTRLFPTNAAALDASGVGGGVFSENGSLVGIVAAAKLNDEGGTFVIPVNYVRGLMATTSRMSLLEASLRFPKDGLPSATEEVSDEARNVRLAAIIAGSKLEWTKDDHRWTTTIKHENAGEIQVEVSLMGDLVLTTADAREAGAVTADQLRSLMERNYTFDLVKVSMGFGGDLVVMNESALRLLDGPGLASLVDAVTSGVAQVRELVPSAPKEAAVPTETAPTLTLPANAEELASLPLLQERARIRYDGRVWRNMGSTEPGSFEFRHADGDLYLRVFGERVEIPLDKYEDMIVGDMRPNAPDAKVVRRGYRMVNGQRMLLLEIEATAKGIPFTFYTHCWSDGQGTVQIMGWSGRNVMKEFRPIIEAFVSGFTVRQPAGVGRVTNVQGRRRAGAGA